MKWFARRRTCGAPRPSACARSSSARRATHAEALERRVLLDGGSLLADINKTTDQLDPSYITPVGAVAYFAGRPAVGAGAEVYKTDGTPGGTVLVKEIVPGLPGGDPQSFTAVNNTVFFSAADPDAGRELWKTDGTAAGTVRVKDINPGAAASTPTHLTAVGNTLFFAATDAAGGTELWKSDGTEAGTVRVKDIATASGSSNPTHFAAVGGVLVFNAGGSSSKQLWRSDGTPEGTYVLPIPGVTSGHPNPRTMTVMGGYAYFAAYPGSHNSFNRTDLFRTDGTAAGTVRVKQLNPTSSSDASAFGLTGTDGLLYFFVGFTTVAGYEMWRSDGTDAGTFRLLSRSTNFNLYSRVTPVGGSRAVFPHRTAATGLEPWVTDGTASGTRLLQELESGPADGVLTFVGLRAGPGAYFAPNTVVGRPQLWGTDGFSAWLAADVSESDGVVWPQAVLGDKVLFNGLRYAGEGDLYAHDVYSWQTTRLSANQAPGGTGNGYSMSDLTSGNEQSPAFVRAGRFVYFEADDGVTGDELWRTDPDAPPGSPPVVRVADVAPGGASSDPAGFTVTDDGTVYFTAATIEAGRELYRVYPGGLGAERVGDLAPGAVSSSPRRLTAVGNVLYFQARDAESAPWALWRYDPATGAMTKVSAPGTATTLTYPSALVRAGDRWYFSADTTSVGTELFVIDGAAATTARLVRDVLPSSADSYPDAMAALGQTLFFAANNAAGVQELWKTDGTAAGTTKLAAPDNIRAIYAHGGAVYVASWGFNAADGALWRSDGTPAGTVKVAAAAPVGQFASVGTDLYYVSASFGTGAAASEGGVFRLDPGSGAVTRVTDAPGTTGFVPQALYAAGGDVYVIGTADDRRRFELWRLDGEAPAAAGTAAASRLRVLAPRVSGGVLSGFFLLGRYAMVADDTHLYFPAYAPEFGIEPHRLSLAGHPDAGYVVGRSVFYNNAPAPAAPAPAAAPDKQALLPGGTGSFENVTSYARGINGLAVDLTAVPQGATVGAGDFDFAVMDGTSPQQWRAPNWTPSVTLRRGEGAGGSDRVMITIPDYAVRNAWLRVTVKANARTGLARPDTFYFGNLVGEAGVGPKAGGAASVTAHDLMATRAGLGGAGAGGDGRHDFDRDGRITARDFALVRGNQRRTLPALVAPGVEPLTIAAAAPAAPPVVAPAAATTSSRTGTRRGVWAEQFGHA